MFNRTNKPHSPLKKPPLRQAGQSLDEEIARLTVDLLEDWSIAIFLFGVSAYEWVRWYFNMPPRPWIPTLFALLASAYCIRKIFPIRRELHNLRQGRDGERAVGQQLETLHEQGFQVLHDFPSDRGNVDHVLVGEKGVFSIETKTYSKPAKGPTEITCDKGTIQVNGFTPERNPIIQAKAEARGLEDLLKERTRKNFHVRPIVVIPGWFVHEPPSSSEVWVLNETRLLGYLKHEKEKLKAEDAALAFSILSDIVHNQRQDKAGS